MKRLNLGVAVFLICLFCSTLVAAEPKALKTQELVEKYQNLISSKFYAGLTEEQKNLARQNYEQMLNVAQQKESGVDTNPGKMSELKNSLIITKELPTQLQAPAHVAQNTQQPRPVPLDANTVEQWFFTGSVSPAFFLFALTLMFLISRSQKPSRNKEEAENKYIAARAAQLPEIDCHPEPKKDWLYSAFLNLLAIVAIAIGLTICNLGASEIPHAYYLIIKTTLAAVGAIFILRISESLKVRAVFALVLLTIPIVGWAALFYLGHKNNSPV